MNKLFAIVIGASMLAGICPARAEEGTVAGVSRVVLGTGLPAAAPGQELSLRRVTFAPKASISGEVHPGMQVVFVVSGHLDVQILGGVAFVRRAQADGSMGAQQEVHAGPTPIHLGPGDSLIETETLVLHPFNPASEPLVILAASLLQAGKPASVRITQPVGAP